MARKTPRTTRSRRKPATVAAAPAKSKKKLVSTWEDDPGDPNTVPAPSPISVPVPTLSATPLTSRIGGKAPAAKIYQPGTAEFRYYACATSLRRGSDFWGSISPSLSWQIGKTLPVVLDDGVDLNAFYTRGGFGDAPGLHFFHAAVGTRTFFSDESPDVVCHEMGHAILDGIRPQLFDAQTIEAAAFHESFGDMSAILTALQVESFRNRVLIDTQGVLNRNSRLSRLAEQLGAAIRIEHPDAVDRDSLRNAVNSFFYRDPQTLPPSAPANALSSEPHSFSRVFTAGFLDVLAGMFKLKGDGASGDDLVAVTRDAALLLVAGVKDAPVVPDYYSQVAAHMLDAGEAAPFSGKYRDVIKSAFVRRGILSLQAATTVTAAPRTSRRSVGGCRVDRNAALTRSAAGLDLSRGVRSLGPGPESPGGRAAQEIRRNVIVPVARGSRHAVGPERRRVLHGRPVPAGAGRGGGSRASRGGPRASARDQDARRGEAGRRPGAPPPDLRLRLRLRHGRGGQPAAAGL